MRVPVLKDLEFSLEKDAFTCLIGPSGCGKTTALRVLAGLDPDFEGTVDPSFREAHLAIAFQEPRLLPWRTIGQNVGLALHGERDGPERILQALAEVGLDGYESRFPSELSLGQLRRAALARAFAVRPQILFLDEPFVSLDEPSAQRLRQLLVQLWQKHKVTVLMVTHNVREAVQLADHIVLLSQRPAKVAQTVQVDIAREGRTADAVNRFASALAEQFPSLITL